MLTLVNIYKATIRKKDGTYSDWYDLLCSDDYISKNHLCGTASKTVRVSKYVLNKALGGDDNSDMIQPAICETKVGQAVYVMHNEHGYVNFIRFYNPDDKSNSSGASSVPAVAPASSLEDYPDFDDVVK